MALYESLFQLEISHDYYRNNQSADFRITPAGDTVRQLRNHGLLFRKNPSGFSVLGEVIPAGGGDVELLRSPEKPARYQFLLHQQQPDFLNYTDLPFHEVGKTIYYFNNLQSNIDGGIKYLHFASDHVTAGDQLDLESGNYRYAVSGTEIQKTARLVFPDLGIEEKQQVSNTEGVFNFQFDLSNYPAGRAELWIDGSKEELFYSAGTEQMAGVFGIIEVFHSNEVPSTYQFLDDNNFVEAQNYQLAFQKRSTFWKYIIVNKSGADLDDPGIQNGSYTFTQDTSGSYPSNYSVFISDQEIPLSQEGIDSLSLRKKFSTSNRKVLDGLPNPRQNMLRRDEANINKFYSEVYLYI
ncbi:hypothetical protein [Fodinibius salsisoli]|uniref:Uncharacterized protein n=1 Tax=Fodinibius salsisoli TaxID=2820877 RepID=A0ABT3PQK7_9BACT|nr:hypothetical protein [Fodinibius salsisoli]MCW9708154.1 hypothetical protein [Fodinibius salsisoli]